ncbi:hypothetical protein NKI31_03565 [Mesorhizobium sp. M0659]|uniref:hypothetical protein n=1 Tax=Mesorhizobium sp. M0659 TaxID=2956980 RepID=UPI00333D67C5
MLAPSLSGALLVRSASKAEWLKPGLVGRVKRSKGEERLRRAKLPDSWEDNQRARSVLGILYDCYPSGGRDGLSSLWNYIATMAQLFESAPVNASYQLIVDHYETAVSLQERIVTRVRQRNLSTKGDDEFLEHLNAVLARVRQRLAQADQRN